MIQYNLRLDEKTKSRAQDLAQKNGISENNLYQMAIEEFLAKSEATTFYAKLMDRVVTDTRKKQIIKKLKSNKEPVLFSEDS